MTKRVQGRKEKKRVGIVIKKTTLIMTKTMIKYFVLREL